MELANYFLARHSELQRVIERTLALSTGDVVGLTYLPAELTRDYAEVLSPSVARDESMRAYDIHIFI